MLSVSFAGWAQCRLATDPDPYDEPRGVSGYMQAYAGEPDLDRIIRFQNPPFVRSHTFPVGVSVKSVVVNGVGDPNHPLVGAAVDLLDNAKFEGRNGVIAEDGREPIVPFNLRLEKGGHTVSRATVPTNPNDPYGEFNARLLDIDVGLIERATGIPSILDVWRSRLDALRTDLQNGSAAERPGIEERIAFIERNIQSGGGVARFYPARMEWVYELKSPLQMSAQASAAFFSGFEPTGDPWRVAFWFGGWDADAQAFFVNGTLEIAEASSSRLVPLSSRPERMTDIKGV